MNSTKSPLPTAAHRLTSVTFNGKELVCYDYDGKVRKSSNNLGEEQYLAYFHFDQIGIQCEMTDKNGNLLWFGNYTAWGRLKEETRVTDSAYQPFRHDLESPLGYA